MSSYYQPSITADALSNLDGYSMQGDTLFTQTDSTMHNETDDFGFDPPTMKHMYPSKINQTYSLPDESDSAYSPWLGSTQMKDNFMQLSPKNTMPSTEIENILAQALPNSSTAISRFGQVTPPRSGSESSLLDLKTTEDSSNTASSERRSKRTSKMTNKDGEPTAVNASNKKRRNARKSSASNLANTEDDDKRRQSLEKNRLAAAKCRVNKKEKTEQLQRDSHDKAVHNAFLKDQIMRMKEELQQMNALLLAHANCEGCKSPDDLQKHLSNLGNEFFAQQIASFQGADFGSFSQALLDMEQGNLISEGYFQPQNDSQHSMLNPPLPDFDRTPDFDVHTPMHND